MGSVVLDMRAKKGKDREILLPAVLPANKGREVIVSGEQDLVNKAVIDKMESDVIILDKDLRIILMNTAAEESLGIRFDDVKGLSYLSLRMKLTNRELAFGLNMVMEERKTLNSKELRYVEPDEHKKFTDFSYMPLVDRENKVKGVISVGRGSFLSESSPHLIENSKGDTKPGSSKESELAETEETDKLEELVQKLSKKESEVKYLQRQLKERYKFHSIIGKSKLMQKVYETIERVSYVDSTVLILGETGTGKELVAKAIHYNSPRSDASFVAVNCAALPETLLEGELFGYVKGAFTGSVRDRKGKFELANGGTLFLDEIGEMSPSTQVKLLRALQEREIERLGDEKTIKVDIRIIAATNRNLNKMMERGEFRRDLYYRLNIIKVNLPDLKDRKDDIPLLLSHFVDIFSKQFGKKISGVSQYAINKLMLYSWPGNVREFQGVVERAVVMSDSDVIRDFDLDVELDIGQRDDKVFPLISGSKKLRPYSEVISFLENYEKEYFISVFKEMKGKINDIAAFTMLTRRTILNKMKKYNINKEDYQVP